MLVELGLVEQRYKAVCEVLDGATICSYRWRRPAALFHERMLSKNVPTHDRRYRTALFHLLTAETSCYRYWGEGVWTAYGAELARRTGDIITYDL